MVTAVAEVRLPRVCAAHPSAQPTRFVGETRKAHPSGQRSVCVQWNGTWTFEARAVHLEGALRSPCRLRDSSAGVGTGVRHGSARE